MTWCWKGETLRWQLLIFPKNNDHKYINEQKYVNHLLVTLGGFMKETNQIR